MGAGELCLAAWGSAVTIVENTQRENLLMDVMKQAKRAGASDSGVNLPVPQSVTAIELGAMEVGA
jgi:hypothetical protein